MVAGFMVCQNTNNTRVNNLLSAYNSYNKATEDLLDTLDNEYDWVDAFDPQDYFLCTRYSGVSANRCVELCELKYENIPMIFCSYIHLQL